MSSTPSHGVPFHRPRRRSSFVRCRRETRPGTRSRRRSPDHLWSMNLEILPISIVETNRTPTRVYVHLLELP